jgi:hypothetical protein
LSWVIDILAFLQFRDFWGYFLKKWANSFPKKSGHPVSHFNAEFQMSPEKNFASVTKNSHVETIFQESSNVLAIFFIHNFNASSSFLVDSQKPRF